MVAQTMGGPHRMGRLNEHSLEDCLGRWKATAIYIVGGWVCRDFNTYLAFLETTLGNERQKHRYKVQPRVSRTGKYLKSSRNAPQIFDQRRNGVDVSVEQPRLAGRDTNLSGVMSGYTC
jgi:hypothetical protein